ncbi:FAD-dependent monooxygenase [Dactylosporangium sp. NPDC051485]|uniref:NAD(P)/FAD-dependent oxidoreductase n=1 Tax=Dactylosporangium sp. NPDC051485 TaxID=3154846 RepID=UPI00341DE31F
MTHETYGGHAVVLGGSMAGLLAARVLTGHFAQVTIVERDELTGEWAGDPQADPREREFRRGVPQGRHAHGLLAAGLNVVEELFPGAAGELAAAGVPSGDVLRNVRFCAGGHRLRQVPIGMTALSCSRPYLENYLRSKVFALPGVRVRGGTDVVGVEADAGRARVTGALVQGRGAGRTEVLPADLVLDATGRGSRPPRWLEELGYERPEEERLHVDLAYVSRHFEVDPALLDGDIAIIIGPSAAAPRGGAVMLQEAGRAVITLFGILGDHAPLDDAGWRAYSRRLPLPYVADVIEASVPLDDAVKFRYPGSTRHRYDRLRRFPKGFVVLGDAMCSFNPMYGQGMSVAGVEALRLRDQLALDGVAGFDALRFFRSVRPVIDIPWRIATGGDAALPGVDGPRDLPTRMVNRYLERLYAIAARDEVVSLAFSRVTNLLDPPTALLRPGIAARVLAGRRLAAS